MAKDDDTPLTKAQLDEYLRDRDTPDDEKRAGEIVYAAVTKALGDFFKFGEDDDNEDVTPEKKKENFLSIFGLN